MKARISNWYGKMLLCCVLPAAFFFGGALHAQTPVPAVTPAPAFDPGPRPTGKDNPALAICPPAAPAPALMSAKFPSDPNCIDVVQPPSIAPAPVADGAGNVVGTTTPGTIGPLWFQALTVFETVATVNGAPNPTFAVRGLEGS